MVVGSPVFEKLEDRTLASVSSPIPGTALALDPLAPLATDSGTITPGVTRPYQFTPSATGSVVIDLLAQSGTLDPYLRVVDANGRVLKTNNDVSTRSHNSRITMPVVEGQTYYIWAQGYRGTQGPYLFSITLTPTDDLAANRAKSAALAMTTAGALSLKGKVDYAGDTDVISIVAKVTGQLTAKVNKNNLAEDLQPKLAIFDSQGNVLGYSTTDSTGTSVASVNVTAGTRYYMRLAGEGATRGTYRLNVLTQRGGAAMRSSELLVTPPAGPIRFQDGFQTQNDVYGYNPQFEPGVVTFGPGNQPFIRTGFDGTDDIETLVDGKWVRQSIMQILKKADPTFNGGINNGPTWERRIVFDHQGGAYMGLETNIGGYLMYKPANQDWQAYKLSPGSWLRVESANGDGMLNSPPAIVSVNYYTNTLDLIVPTKKADGTLNIQKATITTTGYQPWEGCGDSNVAVTVDGKVSVVWADSRNLGPGTAGFAATYDIATGQMTAPTFLGFMGRDTVPDDHCIPVIAADSKGYLHVLLTPHNTRYTYIVSTSPNETSSWSTPTTIAADLTAFEFTYPSMVIDKNDTIHLVSRYVQAGNIWTLSYLQKTATGAWQAPKTLVVPARSDYTYYNASIDIDLTGRLFVNYSYYVDEMTPAEAQDYMDKWPDSHLSIASTLPNGKSYYSGLSLHDPAMLVSSDGGSTWTLATTQTFVQGMDQLP